MLRILLIARDLEVLVSYRSAWGVTLSNTLNLRVWYLLTTLRFKLIHLYTSRLSQIRVYQSVDSLFRNWGNGRLGGLSWVQLRIARQSPSRILTSWRFGFIPLFQLCLIILLSNGLLVISQICYIKIVTSWIRKRTRNSTWLPGHLFLSTITNVITRCHNNSLLRTSTTFCCLGGSLAIVWLWLSGVKSFKRWLRFFFGWRCCCATSKLFLHYRCYLIWLTFKLDK